MNASAPIAFHARPTPHPESATWTVDEIEALYSLPFLKSSLFKMKLYQMSLYLLKIMTRDLPVKNLLPRNL